MAGNRNSDFYGFKLTYKVIREVERIQDCLTVQELIDNIGAKGQKGIYKRVLNLIKGLNKIQVIELKKMPTEIPGITFILIRKTNEQEN